ncbi:MAG: hypothetical protein H7329_02825 [Opitutaceae bacterium]|nr:hypothetical protein [Cytophagales bacterium]
MKILSFIALIALAGFVATQGDESGNSVAKYCTNVVAAAIFLLALWLPGQIGKKDTDK